VYASENFKLNCYGQGISKTIHWSCGLYFVHWFHISACAFMSLPLSLLSVTAAAVITSLFESCMCYTYVFLSGQIWHSAHSPHSQSLVQCQYFTQSWFMIWETFQRKFFLLSCLVTFSVGVCIYLVAFGWLYLSKGKAL